MGIKAACRQAADRRPAHGQIVLSTGTASLRAEPGIVSALCVEAANSGNIYAALAIIVTETDPSPVVPVGQKMLDAAATPATHIPGITEFTGGWQETAALTRARLGEAMTAIAADTDEPEWNRQQALAALAAVGRHLSDRERLFPAAPQAARGDLDSATDDNTPPSGQLDRSRTNLGPTLRFHGLLAAATLANTPDQSESVIDLAYELMPQASANQANHIAQALAQLPVVGRALLDPRTLASHESDWIRSLATAVWSTADGQPPQVGHRLATDPSGNVRRSPASHLPDKSQHEDLRTIEARRPPVRPYRPEDSRLSPTASHPGVPG